MPDLAVIHGKQGKILNKGKQIFMGMAASQVRLLQLTSRKNTIGRQLEGLSMQKTSLTREMQGVTREYQNALNSKVLKWSNNSGASYVDLSYNNLMRPGSANNNTPYLITDKNDKVVVDSKYQKYAEMISPDGFPGGDWASVRSEVLEEITGIPAENIEASEVAQDKVNTTTDSINTLQNEVDTCRKEAKITGGLEKFLGCLGSSWGGVSLAKTLTPASTVQQDYKDANGERCWVLSADLNSSKTQLANMINQMCTSASNYLDTDDAAAFKEACDTTIKNYNNYLENAGEQCGDTCQTSKDTSGVASGKYVVNVELLITELLRNYENAGGTVEQNSYGTDEYTWFDKNSEEYKLYLEKKAKLDAAKEELSTNIDESNQTLTASEENSIKFYDQIFSAIAEKGWVGNSQVSDNDYLNQMLQNNQFYITTIEANTNEEGEEYFEYDTNIASNFENIFTVNDSDAANEALAEYEYQKSIINEKESRIDTRMQNLETEQSAINEMIKGIETVRDDNTERTFSIFS